MKIVPIACPACMKRDAQPRANAESQCKLATFGEFMRFGPEVGDVDRPSLNDGASGDEATHQGQSELPTGPPVGIDP